MLLDPRAGHHKIFHNGILIILKSNHLRRSSRGRRSSLALLRLCTRINAGNKSPCERCPPCCARAKVQSSQTKDQATLWPETENPGLRSLYKQTLVNFTNDCPELTFYVNSLLTTYPITYSLLSKSQLIYCFFM